MAAMSTPPPQEVGSDARQAGGDARLTPAVGAGDDPRPCPRPHGIRPPLGGRPGDIDVQCVDVGEDDGALDYCEADNSCMKVYARTILERLRKELSSSSATDNWLLRKLKAEGWWLRAQCAGDVMAQLDAASDPASWPEPFYIRDIFVWLPESRWGEIPTCPTCDSDNDIHPHDFQMDHTTRRKVPSCFVRPPNGILRRAGV